MSGPFEKYIAQAAKVLSPHIQVWRDRDGQERAVCVHDDWESDTEGHELSDAWAEHLATIALPVIGPLITEDTRERMVAAAGAVLEREGAGCSDLDSCIWVDPGRQSGQACFGGTRIPVAPFMAIVEEAGEDAAKAFWPGVTDAHIKAGRAYERGRRETLKEIANEMGRKDSA